MTRSTGLPKRVFLDTSVVNLWLDYGESIHDGARVPPGTTARITMDVEALRYISITGSRAHWQIVVSPLTYDEVIATQVPTRAHALRSWFWEVWSYSCEYLSADPRLSNVSDAERIRFHTLNSTGVCDLDDQNDRLLLSDALVYRCDLFCTRDWSTILRHRDKLTELPISIVTPSEWWSRIRPWASNWV